jgi:predicted  nucleic acid-binding Zn-ribbon protein
MAITTSFEVFASRINKAFESTETTVKKLEEENIKLKKENEYLNTQCYSFGNQLDKVGLEKEELEEELEECALERDSLEEQCIQLKEQIQKLQKYKEGLDTIAHKHGYTI